MQSFSHYEKFVNTGKKLLENKLNGCRKVLFQMKTRVSVKYFVNDCLWKYFFVSNLLETPSNLIPLTILATLRSLTQF